MYGEGMVNPLYDSSALFDARAMLLQASREELLRYLDVPAFERGDLFYIHKLISTLEASPLLEKAANVSLGYQGDAIIFTLSLYSHGTALTLTDSLPVGMSAPAGDIEIHGTNVLPQYEPVSHSLTWVDAPADGQQITIRYTVTISTRARRALTNLAELQEPDGDLRTASVTIFANTFFSYLPIIVKTH
jgi:hypothetical protein